MDLSERAYIEGYLISMRRRVTIGDDTNYRAHKCVARWKGVESKVEISIIDATINQEELFQHHHISCQFRTSFKF